MNPYTILLGLVALILCFNAWRERREGNRRDAGALLACGSGLGALAGIFEFVL